MILASPCCWFQAVASIQCEGITLKGRVAEMRDQLVTHLPEGDSAENGTDHEDSDASPEYETQDNWDDDVEDDDDEDNAPHIQLDVPLKDMNIGDCVEVYWKGDNVWYEGEILDVCETDQTYKVHYELDSQTLWHKCEEYPCRFAC